MTSNGRHSHIRKKYEQDQAHIQYLLDSGWHPFKIAAQMTEYTIQLLKEGIRQKHPGWTDLEVIYEARKKITIDKKLRRKRFKRGLE